MILRRRSVGYGRDGRKMQKAVSLLIAVPLGAAVIIAVAAGSLLFLEDWGSTLPEAPEPVQLAGVVEEAEVVEEPEGDTVSPILDRTIPEPADKPVVAGPREPAAATADTLPPGSDSAAVAPRRCGPVPDGTVAEMEAAERVPIPDAVRGIYLNAWAWGSSRRRAQLIDLAVSTEVNTFVIDVKDASGYVSYPTRVPLAQEIGADCEIRIRGIRGALDQLLELGIFPVARIVVFLDPLLADGRPDLAIQHLDGGTWRDHHGQLWVDPFNREVWDYHIQLAREAVKLGFAEIQWDYVRFPDVPRSYMATAVYPARNDRIREEAIRQFMEYSREQLADLEVPVTADVFGLTVSAQGDMGIGQRWESMLDVTDVLLPMIYPSHFAQGSYGIDYPNAQPYRVILTALEDAVRRSTGVEGAAAIRPWLQDFTLGSPPYGAAEVRAQIEAVYDAGLTEWVLWNSGSRYTAGALASPEGVPPDLPEMWGIPPDSIPPDSIPPDSIPPDSIPPDSTPPDSTPPDSTPPDSTPPDRVELEYMVPADV